jgi:hypothetical protein
MYDEVQVLAHRQRIRHIRPHIHDIGIEPAVFMQRQLVTGDVVVGRYHPARFRQDLLIQPAEHRNEMPPEKSSAAGQQYRLAGETVRIGIQVRDNVFDVVVHVCRAQCQVNSRGGIGSR